MEVKLEKKEDSKVILEFTMPKADFNKKLDEEFVKNAKYFNIPGFRKGRVPRAIIEKVYGPEVLDDSVVNDIADDEYRKAVEANNLKVVSKPELDVKQIGKDKDLIYTVTVYVRPEATVKQYKGLEIEKCDTKVTSKDLDQKLEQIRDTNARVISVEDRELKDKDIANIDFEGSIDGVKMENGSDKNFDLTIGSKTFIPGFEEQLIGMKLGDTKNIKVKFPDDYQAKDLAGKEADFKVKLNSIKYKELPKLDDEFAKDVSEFETLKEYKESLKKQLEDEKINRAKNEKQSKAIQKLIENVDVKVPEAMIEDQIDQNMQQFKSNLAYQGLTLEKYCELVGSSLEDIRKQFRPSAENDVKLILALEYIEKNEKIEVTDEEIDKKIDELVSKYKKDDQDDITSNAENLKKNENVRQYTKEQIKQDKLLDIVVDSAIEK